MAARQAEGTKGEHEADRLLAPFSTLSPSFVLRCPGRHTTIKNTLVSPFSSYLCPSR
jgi:hypothetical protein